MASSEEKRQTWIERLGHSHADLGNLIAELRGSSVARQVEILVEKLTDDIIDHALGGQQQAPVDPAIPAMGTGTGEIIGAAWLPTRPASAPRMDTAE